jgi:hypothetical protein
MIQFLPVYFIYSRRMRTGKMGELFVLRKARERRAAPHARYSNMLEVGNYFDLQYIKETKIFDTWKFNIHREKKGNSIIVRFYHPENQWSDLSLIIYLSRMMCLNNNRPSRIM